jgi:hypothetical protein
MPRPVRTPPLDIWPIDDRTGRGEPPRLARTGDTDKCAGAGLMRDSRNGAGASLDPFAHALRKRRDGIRCRAAPPRRFMRSGVRAVSWGGTIPDGPGYLVESKPESTVVRLLHRRGRTNIWARDLNPALTASGCAVMPAKPPIIQRQHGGQMSSSGDHRDPKPECTMISFASVHATLPGDALIP